MNDYKAVILNTVLDEKTFVKATFSNPLALKESKRYRSTRVGRNPEPTFLGDHVKKVVVRPILIKEKKHIQFSYFTKTQDITKNYQGKNIKTKLADVFRLPFSVIMLQTTTKDIYIEALSHERIKIHEKQREEIITPPTFSHDQPKQLIIPDMRPNLYLEAAGIMNKEGKVYAHMYNKFRQINKFLKIISQEINTITKSSSQSSQEEKQDKDWPLPLEGSSERVWMDSQENCTIIDFGCGNGYLTFAVAYYLNEVLKMSVHVIGVDRQEQLLKELSGKVKQYKLKSLSFVKSTIMDFKPPTNPHMVMSLHACDTATDDVLAKGIEWKSSFIFASPCCHHHLQKQLHNSEITPLFHPMMRNGILKERLGDMLTDTFRELLLQIAGYKTDIIQFISPEDTAKNVLIRAVKSENLNMARYKQEYENLKKYWKVKPYLEGLL